MANIQSYLLLGAENGLKQEYLNELKIKISQNNISLSVHKFYGYEVDVEEIFSLLQSPSLFGEITWIEIMMCETLKKNVLKDISSFLKRKFTGVGYLIFLSDEDKVDKILDFTVISSGHKQIFNALSGNEFMDIALKYVEKIGYSITEEALYLLVSRIESDTLTLKRTIDFLVNTVSVDVVKEITVQSVQDYVERSKEITVHDLFFAVAKRDLNLCLELAQQLIYSKEGLSVITLIVLNRSFKAVIDYRTLLNSGYSSAEALKELKIFYQRAESTKIANKNFTNDELSSIMSYALSYDLAARDSNKDFVKQVIFHYLISCCTKPFLLYESKIR